RSSARAPSCTSGGSFPAGIPSETSQAPAATSKSASTSKACQSLCETPPTCRDSLSGKGIEYISLLQGVRMSHIGIEPHQLVRAGHIAVPVKRQDVDITGTGHHPLDKRRTGQYQHAGLSLQGIRQRLQFPDKGGAGA